MFKRDVSVQRQRRQIWLGKVGITPALKLLSVMDHRGDIWKSQRSSSAAVAEI